MENFKHMEVELMIIMNLYVSITKHVGAYDLDIHELPNKLHVIGLSSVFKEK